MDPQGPSSALRKHIEVATRLRGLDVAEARAMPWNCEIGGLIRCDLRKNTAGRVIAAITR
jgi:hypothetical protein